MLFGGARLTREGAVQVSKDGQQAPTDSITLGQLKAITATSVVLPRAMHKS